LLGLQGFTNDFGDMHISQMVGRSCNRNYGGVGAPARTGYDHYIFSRGHFSGICRHQD
jgi:hypothetical protein